MSMPIYRVMAQKREDKEKEEMEKKEKEEASIHWILFNLTKI